MSKHKDTLEELTKENVSLREQLVTFEQRCKESEEALGAIRRGEVDALVVYTDEGEKIYTIQGAETTYRLLVESINEGAATLIEDGTILYCNQRFADMLATPLETIIGTSILQYIPQEYQVSFSSLLQQGLTENCRGEFELLQRGGQSLPAMISFNNFSASGSPGVSLIASDLIERKKIEDVIRKEASVSETLVEYSKSLVGASLDEYAIMTFTIRSAVQLIGDICITRLLSPDGKSFNMAEHYHPDPVINGFLKTISPVVSIRADEGLSGQVVRTGQAVLLPQFKLSQLKPLVNSDLFAIAKKFKVSSLLVVPLQTQHKTIGTLILARLPDSHPYDNNDLSLAQRIANQAALAMTNARLYLDLENLLKKEQTMRLQLIQAEKLSAMSRMMATVVHEINNPMQTIKNCIYLASLDIQKGSSAEETLNMASSEIDRISKLVSSLRDIYRQPKNLEVEPLDLAKLVTTVHMLLEPHLQHQKVVWESALPVDPIWTGGVGDHLKQVFLNISMNAIEAMQPNGGTLTISMLMDVTKEEVAVKFTDTGVGIQPDEMQKLFEPFYTTKEGGSGLGLPICYEIIQHHSGRITVDSTPGLGSTFTVWLPMISLPQA
jgi:PAS domain S-box-containing protein